MKPTCKQRKAPPWLCDGHGHWYHHDHGIVPASVARSLGALVPAGEQDPVDDDGVPDVAIDEEGWAF